MDLFGFPHRFLLGNTLFSGFGFSVISGFLRVQIYASLNRRVLFLVPLQPRQSISHVVAGLWDRTFVYRHLELCLIVKHGLLIPAVDPFAKADLN
jgi:hypothetical protein